MNPKISVITVCYNAGASIETTLVSVASQSYSNVEYIVVDGASSDSTLDIIDKFKDNIDIFVSEPDSGVYDAMNKGVSLASGDYIIMMNAGDTFFNSDTLTRAAALMTDPEVDVYYGDCVEILENRNRIFRFANPDASMLSGFPIYRHGASFVKAGTHKKYMFDLSKSATLGYALDFNQIFSMYKAGCRFRKIDVTVLVYEKVGMSDNIIQSVKYIQKIVADGKPESVKRKLRNRLSLMKISLISNTRTFSVINYLYSFGAFLVNGPFGNFPSYPLRRFLLRRLGAVIGKGSTINMGQFFMQPNHLHIGEHTHINRGCLIDSRAPLYIGNSVSISHRVMLLTGSHDANSRGFDGVFYPIRIEDHVWIGAGATILQNVRIGEGAVVAAGAVVTSDVEPYTIVGGIPAKKIGVRNSGLDYKCIWETPFC